VSTTVDLPDLNVWLALAYPDHSHHRQALHYWEQQAAEQVLFCTVTAPALLEAFCQQPGVSIAMQEQGGWDVFHQLLRSDAYLAAVAIANGWRLVSFDRDFERFKGLERLALPGVQA
jgi:uncharacterized protein